MTAEIELLTSADEWTERVPVDFLADPYYSWDYLLAWAEEGLAEPLGLVLSDARGIVVYPVLRRPLAELPGGGDLFDVRSPYDFGGPRLHGSSPGLLATFEDRLCDWCRANRVVTEFARLHPFAIGQIPKSSTLHAENLVVELRLSEDELAQRQHPSHRWAARFGRRAGLQCRWIDDPEVAEVEAWFRLYAETMERIGAPLSYRFSERLFGRILSLPGIDLATVESAGEPVAAAIFLVSGEDAFYYLSASAEPARQLKASNFLLDCAIHRFRDRGSRFLHLGGGAPGLRHFKGQVATTTVPYYVLRRVHLQGEYERLREVTATSSSDTFPAYLDRLRGRL